MREKNIWKKTCHTLNLSESEKKKLTATVPKEKNKKQIKMKMRERHVNRNLRKKKIFVYASMLHNTDFLLIYSYEDCLPS